MISPVNNAHEHWEGEAAAYALDALDAYEVRAFEEHLAGCAHCQQELASFREVVAALPDAVPELAPAPELRQRVLAGIAAEPRPEAVTTVAPEPRPRTAPRRTRTRGQRSTGFSWLRPQLAVGFAALVAVLVVVGVLTLGGSGSTTYNGIVHAQGASASVVRSGNSGQLRFTSMPAPPQGRIYQVWLQHRTGAPQPTHSLFASRTGSVTVHGSLHGVKEVLVTDEPRPNGSTSPTRSPIIIVHLA